MGNGRIVTTLMLLLCLTGISIPSMAAASTDANSLASSPLSTPYLGSYPEQPVLPKTLFGLSRQATAASAGFTVDIASREQTRNFYNAIYPVSEGVPLGWTGDLTTCAAGTTSPGFKEAVLLRVNFFRAMAGVPAAITFSDVYSAKSQQAALMMSRNNALNHKPPNTWTCYSADGFEAAGKSNLSLGNSGAAAVTGSFMDFGVSNGAVGHRRWLLYPQTQVMGTGDIPDTNGYSAASSLWVVDNNFGNNRPATREEFVAWPPPGYAPYQTVFSRWSFAYPGADFSSAGVSMTRNGVPLSIRLETFVANVAENTLVWVPDNMATATVSTFPRPVADTPYTVTVSNVKIGGVLRNFTYTVTVFDPQTPGVDKMSSVITGSTSPSTGFAAPYVISPVTGADSYQWQSAVSTLFTGSYGAETGLTGITTSVSSGYSPIVSGISASW
jgi:Cysteine-rich secretory protein family